MVLTKNFLFSYLMEYCLYYIEIVIEYTLWWGLSLYFIFSLIYFPNAYMDVLLIFIISMIHQIVIEKHFYIKRFIIHVYLLVYIYFLPRFCKVQKNITYFWYYGTFALSSKELIKNILPLTNLVEQAIDKYICIYSGQKNCSKNYNVHINGKNIFYKRRISIFWMWFPSMLITSLFTIKFE